MPMQIEKKRARILVVDDQPINIQAIYRLFAGEHDVFMATNGTQALEFCRKDIPDLILLDVIMPDTDGLEVCRQLKLSAETKDIPIIFVTAHNTPEEQDACWDAGGVDFITKPINPSTVRNRVRAHLTLKFQADLLRQLVLLDGLTGVANRRFFDERLEREWRRCKRNGHPLSLLMLDVDYFKKFNDRYGHIAGDECLKLVAGCMKQVLQRPDDLPARYGGEEFACILPETKAAGACQLGRELEASIRALGIEHQASEIADVVTVSIGVAEIYPIRHTEVVDLIKEADQQLYAAKQAGRGRVHCAEEGAEEQRMV
ncbi:diguanylate cyclase [Hahella sp. KA22]|uniref:diguanylate cyclase n=1 Tax=Hahella sp. KA22 TaxID=1628392 RepID=UPI000FDDFB6D|nr:diguanylate cyclase [Hahella sp. KA22]AZZ92896.1 diguanylate cyclase [Hahella sp. KA22]QAY56270.1 diguanylate cyclase [Hahella sp. KA22]